MTQNEKDLLLKDLCGRLPYRVKCEITTTFSNKRFAQKVEKLNYLILGTASAIVKGYDDNTSIKPYLFPLSSMTEEQKEDLLVTVVGEEGLKLFSVTKDGIVSNDKEEQSIGSFCFNNINFSNRTTEAYIDWLNKNFFDYRGLIPMGIAIDATGKSVY